MKPITHCNNYSDSQLAPPQNKIITLNISQQIFGYYVVLSVLKWSSPTNPCKYTSRQLKLSDVVQMIAPHLRTKSVVE